MKEWKCSDVQKWVDQVKTRWKCKARLGWVEMRRNYHTKSNMECYPALPTWYTQTRVYNAYQVGEWFVKTNNAPILEYIVSLYVLTLNKNNGTLNLHKTSSKDTKTTQNTQIIALFWRGKQRKRQIAQKTPSALQVTYFEQCEPNKRYSKTLPTTMQLTNWSSNQVNEIQ